MNDNTNPNLTCQYCFDNSNGITQRALCRITNENCGRVRICQTKQFLVMTDGYYRDGCAILNDYKLKVGENMEENVQNENIYQEKIIKQFHEDFSEDKSDENIKLEETSFLTQNCKIRSIVGSTLYIEFIQNNDMYVLPLNLTSSKTSKIISKKEITIKYESELGKENFKYFL